MGAVGEGSVNRRGRSDCPGRCAGSVRRVEGLLIASYARKGPPDLATLLGASLEEGHGLVRRTLDEWVDGTNRFDRPGEVFFVSLVGESSVGMCGLNVDPFVNDPGLGRVRHLYVLPGFRRGGIGTTLVNACIRHAHGHFDRLRLRTFEPVAAAFYESIGFAPVDEPAATHALTLGGVDGDG